MRFLQITLFIIVKCFLLLSAHGTFAQNKNAEKVSEVKTPELIVSKYINALGERNFKKAYSYINSLKWGNESQFSTTKFLGGITETLILEKPVVEKCLKEVENECVKAKVFVKYFAKDPTNDTRKCKKAGKVYDYFFFLEKKKDYWKIIDGTLDEQTCNPSPTPPTAEYLVHLKDVDSLPSTNDTATIETPDTTLNKDEDKAEQTTNNGSKTKEKEEENIVFTEIFNPKYWYIYVIIFLLGFIIGLMCFLPLRYWT